jgi:phage protein D
MGLTEYTPDFKLQADGLDITSRLRSHLLELVVKDDAGRESDTINLTLDDTGDLPLPGEGAVLEAWLGYKETGLHFMGRFAINDISSEGSDSGQTLKISGKSADMRDRLKERGFRHYDDQSLGDIFKAEASAHGLQAYVAPERAAARPGYVIRDNISLLHFGEQLARKYDAAFKIAASRLLFVTRQSGKSLSGQELPTIEAVRPGNLLSWSVKPRIGRPHYGSVRAEWYDPQKAQRVSVEQGADTGPVHTRRYLARDESEAKASARSKKNELDRQKSGGSITLIGTPTAMAESKVSIAGTRDGVDGWWFGKSVEHRLSGSGFTTRVQIEPKL